MMLDYSAKNITIIYMVLFTTEFITKYRNDPGIKRMLGGVVLLNRNEFFHWYIEELRKTSRKITIPGKYVDGGVDTPSPINTGISDSERQMILNIMATKDNMNRNSTKQIPSKASKRPVTAKRGNYPSKRRTAKSVRTTKDVFRFIKEADRIKEEQKAQLAKIANDTFKEIANEVCDPSIGRDYGRTSLINITKYYDFDFLVAVTPDYNKIPPMMNYEKQRIYKRKKILGFLIAERGECRMKRNTYSVNLICIQKNPVLVGSKPYTVKGTILLGAFLYCIKSYDGILELLGDEGDEGEDEDQEILPVDQQGILELAGAYENLDGFFAYSKLGFKKDISLLTHRDVPNNERCFYDPTLLQMIAPMNQFDSPQHIIQRVTGERRMTPMELIENDKIGLIQTGLPNTIPENEEQKKLQKKIAEDANLYYKIETDLHLFSEEDDDDGDGHDFTRNFMNDIYERIQKNLKIYLRIRAGLSENSPDAYTTDTEKTGSQLSQFSEDSLDQSNKRPQFTTKSKAKKRARTLRKKSKNKKKKISPR